MKNTDIAQSIADRTGVTTAEAADQLDEVMTSILKALKKGRSARIPGLGRVKRDLKGAIRFVPTRPGAADAPR